jgi:hypothetical protein
MMVHMLERRVNHISGGLIEPTLLQALMQIAGVGQFHVAIHS